ncbi:ubiquitin carboxyl-terminal hydrolase 48-like isoform X2 [Heterodontus francisci]
MLLDIPLPIRSFDRPFSFKSVNESLRNFLEVETLSGDNLCYCEPCQKKTKTKTRYYFESLPQILVLQLKRFEFDYFTMCFTKLQDSIEIPLKLTFQKMKIKDTDKTEWRPIPLESKEATKSSERSRKNESEESQILLEDESQENYELFAICDHSGGYRSGHYVAYIKPVSSSKWYCFNDTNVTELKDFISGVCNGSTGSTEGIPCRRSSTAYMLMYRKEEVNSFEGENAVEEKESTQPMKMSEENGSLELGRMGDGEDNHYPERYNQTPDQNSENLPEKNATVTNEGNETMVEIEERKCEMKEKERQTQETDVTEGVKVMKEKSTETVEMVTTEITQGEQCQIYRKENVATEKLHVGDLEDCEGKTVEKVIGTEKENRNAIQTECVMEKNKLKLEFVRGDNEKLNEDLMESNADEKSIKESNGTEQINERSTVQERNHTIVQNEMEQKPEEQKGMEQTSQSKRSQCDKRLEEIKQLQGRKEEKDVKQNEYSSEKEERQIIGEKGSQEEEKKGLLAETKKGERREQTSGENVPKNPNKSDNLQENGIEESPETENRMARNRSKRKGFLFWEKTNKQKRNSKTNKKSPSFCSCLGKVDEN